MLVVAFDHLCSSPQVCKIMFFDLLAVDGNFGPWSAWSVCTATCGGGAMSRFRNCSDPIPLHGGKGCERIGAAFEIKSCGDSFCPGMLVLQWLSITAITISCLIYEVI